MEITLANPRGFCAGVDRAIEIVERALELFGAPIYVRHEVVHNRYVVEGLRSRGAVFVEDLRHVPDGSTLIFSAHGVPLSVRRDAESRCLKVFDATCPLVTKVHLEVARHSRDGRDTILIGHAGHPEVEGTMGQYDTSFGGTIYLVEDEGHAARIAVRKPDCLAVVTQTTLSVDDTGSILETLQRRFPGILTPRRSDICYATQNRQDAVKQLTETCDLVLVVGSRNSSNSNRLREIAARRGVAAYLVDGPEDIDADWLRGRQRIGLTAGASAPEILVEQVIEALRNLGADYVSTEYENPEEIVFNLPKELRANPHQH